MDEVGLLRVGGHLCKAPLPEETPHPVMVSRRGRPAHIWSDNGTNFVGADREIQEALERLNEAKITDELSQHCIQWHFNPPAAPHFGGVWERLMKSAKRALKAVAGNQRVTDETLLTFMAEAEQQTVNSRQQ